MKTNIHNLSAAVLSIGFLFSSCDEIKDLADISIKDQELPPIEIDLSATTTPNPTSKAVSMSLLGESDPISLKDFLEEKANVNLSDLKKVTLSKAELKIIDPQFKASEHVSSLEVRALPAGSTSEILIATANEPISNSNVLTFTINKSADLVKLIKTTCTYRVYGVVLKTTNVSASLYLTGTFVFNPID